MPTLIFRRRRRTALSSACRDYSSPLGPVPGGLFCACRVVYPSQDDVATCVLAPTLTVTGATRWMQPATSVAAQTIIEMQAQRLTRPILFRRFQFVPSCSTPGTTGDVFAVAWLYLRHGT